MTDLYNRIDIWEAIKSHVLEAAPHLAERLAALHAQPWQGVTMAEAQLLAYLVASGQDPQHPANRRRARAELRDLLAGHADAPELSPAARKKLLRSLQWLEQEPLAEWLAASPGAVSAATTVSRNAPALAGMRAYRFLEGIGYPVCVPERARVRCLERLGWIDQRDATGDRAEASASLEALAHALSVPAAELNLILAAFCGSLPAARHAAPCGTQPRCGECPVSTHCEYHRHAGALMRARRRRLSDVTREEQRPRERLEAVGPQALSEEELLAILLRTGSNGQNAVDLANALLREAGSLERLHAMSVGELARFPGMGRVKAITVRAALELARRLRVQADNVQRPRLNTSRLVYEHLRPHYVGHKKEEVLVLLLNVRLELIRSTRISLGTLDGSPVNPREVYAEAIRESAHSIILAHNHPSGDPTPSRLDKIATERIEKAGEVVGIKLLDHIIIGADSYYSFRDEGHIPSSL